jgi:hypothetical protein
MASRIKIKNKTKNNKLFYYLFQFLFRIMGLKQILGLLGSILNISLQLSPIPEIYNGFKRMDIKSLTISYFVVGITQGIFWIGYGLNISDIVVYGPNITIYALFTIYLNVTIYVKVRYKLFFLTNIPLAILCYFSCEYFSSSINVVSATIVSIFWQTTNVETMRLALKHHDSAYINLLLSIVTFCCFVIMAIYSLLIDAYVMFIPYFYGSILNFINIYIYCWCNNKISRNNCFINLLSSLLKVEDTYENDKDIKNPEFMKDEKNNNLI